MSWPYHSGNIAFLFTLYRMSRAVGGCNVILQDPWFSWKHLSNYWPKIVFEDICILLRVYIDRYKCSNTIKCYTSPKHDTHNRTDSFLSFFIPRQDSNHFASSFFQTWTLLCFPIQIWVSSEKNHLFPISIYRTMKFRTTPSPPLETVSITDE
jgi:hypothetical protein